MNTFRFSREPSIYLEYLRFVMHFRSCFGMSLYPRPGLKFRKGSDGAVEDIGKQVLLLLTMDIACDHVFEMANFSICNYAGVPTAAHVSCRRDLRVISQGSSQLNLTLDIGVLEMGVPTGKPQRFH